MIELVAVGERDPARLFALAIEAMDSEALDSGE
jgi:hypothetical protein